MFTEIDQIHVGEHLMQQRTEGGRGVEQQRNNAIENKE